MPETKTMSKVEKFALQKAQEQVELARETFQDLVNEIAKEHGVDQAAGPDWKFKTDFSAMIYTPRPKADGEEKPAANAAKVKK